MLVIETLSTQASCPCRHTALIAIPTSNPAGPGLPPARSLEFDHALPARRRGARARVLLRGQNTSSFIPSNIRRRVCLDYRACNDLWDQHDDFIDCKDLSAEGKFVPLADGSCIPIMDIATIGFALATESSS